jgi:hypothetical protein
MRHKAVEPECPKVDALMAAVESWTDWETTVIFPVCISDNEILLPYL